MMIKKFGALLLSAVLCVGMAVPAFAYGGEPVEEVEQPVLTDSSEEDAVTVTDESSGALTPEGNLTLVDDYHTNYSDGSGQQFITLVSKSGNTFYLVIDRNAKGQQTVHFMNLVDEADLLALMEEDAADAYTAEKEAAVQAELERKQAEEDAKKAAEEAAASDTEQPKENKVTKIASGFLGVVVLIALVWSWIVLQITPLLIIKFALTILWLIGFEWVFALQARFENTVAGTLKNAFIFGISHIAMTVALVIVDAVFVALLVASWFYMPGGLFLLVILGYGTMLMLHIPVTERVFNPYLID